MNMNCWVPSVGFSLLVACSASPPSSSDDSGAPEADAGGAAEAGPSDRDASVAWDASPILDATTDARADGGAARRCGHGTFTQADALLACAVPNTYLDSGLPGEQTRRCDGATITGGSWEVWCSSGPLLVKLHLDGLTATGAYGGCGGFTEIKVWSGWSHLNGQGSGMLPTTAAPLGFDVTMPIAIDLATLGNTNNEVAGSGHLFLIGEFPPGCGALRPRAVMSGVAIAWNAATGD